MLGIKSEVKIADTVSSLNHQASYIVVTINLHNSTYLLYEAITIQGLYLE